MTTPPIAIVGMACEYPDAHSPAELWENVLAQRRAFRRMPPERLRLADYHAANRSAPDRTYATEAALIRDYAFDRVAFRVVGDTYRSADPAHWLALDVASRALADAGLDGEVLPREATGVFLGNTLTGEFSRANTLRLRWPYVRRVLEASLVEEGWEIERRHAFLDGLERRYKAPFPPVGEETLAGGLSNTIAGRICNSFDLGGGGFTVDGACASSLLAVAQACSALAIGDLDAALAGGVDLSLDPFELVGFAKTGALADDDMRIYDARSAGFWPGEGCGFVALMRWEDAMARGLRVLAVIRGWGISSDGHGGITRPEADGQRLALGRAYRRAGYGIDSVALFEGHGTGTAVGDATELRALSLARRDAGFAPPAAIGSIKANIGHTKAAAGVAGLIKAVMAIDAQIRPPTTGCEQPHPELQREDAALRVLNDGELWPGDRPLRAGVSAMGFGGINVHVSLEGVTPARRRGIGRHEQTWLASHQDAELILLGGRDLDDLLGQVDQLRIIAPGVSRSELTDLAAEQARRLDHRRVRSAIVARDPAELAERLVTLRSWLEEGIANRQDPRSGLFLGHGAQAPRIAYLFPGQGSPARRDGGLWRRRFAAVRDHEAMLDLPDDVDDRSTAFAQPAIIAASLAARGVLDRCGIKAEVAVGHSLGELVALAWSGAISEDAALRIATARGRAMAALADADGAMAGIGAGRSEVEPLLADEPLSIAGWNGPRQTVVSGKAAAVDRVVERARGLGFPATRLPVSHAFHSPLVAAAVPALAEALDRETFAPPRRDIASTITGDRLGRGDDLRELLCRQVTAPVRFADAVAAVGPDIDLWIEVGPGRVLTGLVAASSDAPAVALDAGGPSLRGLLTAVGASFALGAAVEPDALFADRFTRPFDMSRRPRFFENPCEQAPISGDGDQVELRAATSAPIEPFDDTTRDESAPERHAFDSIPDLVRSLVAERAELPPAAIGEAHRLLGDLHLNSITVGQIVAEAARRLGLAPPVAPTLFADATVAEVAQALGELAETGETATAADQGHAPAGIGPWVRSFAVRLAERDPPRRSVAEGQGSWRVIAPPDHPLAETLGPALEHAGGPGGVVVCLPPAIDEESAPLLLAGARGVLATEGSTCFVLVTHGQSGAAFARSLHREAPRVATLVVDVPPDHPRAVDWVVAEARLARGYTEAYYDSSGRRCEPILELLAIEDEDPRDAVIGPGDVLLVSGGGKGIAAECALALARQTGVRLALMGRSSPEADNELTANLRRMEAAGITTRYLSADVTVAEAVRKAVQRAERELGPITALLHGAGTNTPQSLMTLDEAAIRGTLAPKVWGLRHLLDAVDTNRLRLLATFGSIIARAGMPGEADYALANERLARLTEAFAAEHPTCRCLCLEWSVWSGVGMGERLGTIDALARAGITPITPDAGAEAFRRLVTRPLPSTSIVVSGRFGDAPTLRLDRPELPLLRFLERPRVYYPGVELVVEADLSPATDPYLDDHVVRGDRLLPAVLGLEAMAQAASAAIGSAGWLTFENVRFDRPVAVSENGSTTIRLAVLVTGPGQIEVALRCEETGFQADHFRATCRFSKPERTPNEAELFPADAPEVPEADLLLDPGRDLYGAILFHEGRFRRLLGYRTLRATECLAELQATEPTDWFGRYLPGRLLLGDPGARDAAIHAIQACIPHATLLPVGVDRIELLAEPGPGRRRVRARERSRDGDLFTYDLLVTDADGHRCEQWEGLRLRAVGESPTQGPWVAPLLGPYLERRVRELIPGSSARIIAEENGDGERRHRTNGALRRVQAGLGSIHRRPDGKPEATGSAGASAAHAGDLTLAVSGDGPIGCDVEPVSPRPAAVWRDLLGSDRFALAQLIARETGEDPDSAATRVWSAIECLIKSGAPIDTAPVIDGPARDGWLLLRSGYWVVATYLGLLRGDERRSVFAIGERPSWVAPTNTDTWWASKRPTSSGMSTT